MAQGILHKATALAYIKAINKFVILSGFDWLATLIVVYPDYNSSTKLK